MTAVDDLRALSTVDKRHHLRAQDATDRWFDQFEVLSVTSRDGTPLVAVNLRHPSLCPVDPADMQVVHWLTNLDADKRMLGTAYAKLITKIHDYMVEVGAKRWWGIVRERNEHIVEIFETAIGEGVVTRVVLEDGPIHGWYYIGGLDVDTFMRSPSAEGGSG